jgi:hypothetical protein
VLPNVHAEDGLAFAAGDGFAHDRIVLIGGGNDFQLAGVDDEPGPAAASARRRQPSFSLNASNPPNVALISSLSRPVGEPPAFGAMIFQNIEWLT